MRFDWSRCAVLCGVPLLAVLFGVGLVVTPVGSGLDCVVMRPNEREPGGTAGAVQEALTYPDKYAWELFGFLNRQASPGVPGAPDPLQPTIRDYEPDKAVVWETWALISGTEQNVSEVFKNRATLPAEWEDLPREREPGKRLFGTLKSERTLDELIVELRSAQGLADITHALWTFFLPTLPGSAELRMNRSAYETVRGEQLYSVEGIERAYKRARSAGKGMIVQFRPSAKEVKAQWVQIKDVDKPRYHWRSVRKADGTEEPWGLVALHITTRDLPSWFWCTFEHVGQPVADVPSELRNSKWEYYRLCGTQTGFLDSRGEPTSLANPVIEKRFPNSSCISCHARAAVCLHKNGGQPGQHFPNTPEAAASMSLEGAGNSPAPPGAAAFGTPTDPNPYLQTDFVWSILTRAWPEPRATTP